MKDGTQTMVRVRFIARNCSGVGGKFPIVLLVLLLLLVLVLVLLLLVLVRVFEPKGKFVLLTEFQWSICIYLLRIYLLPSKRSLCLLFWVI